MIISATDNLKPSDPLRVDNVESFDPDCPITPGENRDRLGFASLAKMLAKSLSGQQANRGLVVSIEGEWGSGKSSLLEFLLAELEDETDKPPTIVRFEPWLVGDRKAMLFELMSDLASAIEVNEDRKQKDLAQKIRRYGSMLSRRLSPFAKISGALDLPLSDLFSKTLEAIDSASEAFDDQESLHDLKSELVQNLGSYDGTIFVAVDDLDRLEPEEMIEILRLLKAVANFPNVVYILCFDPNALYSTLDGSLKIDGRRFLEKIVQVRFQVPQPESFDLRRWLLDETTNFYSLFSGRELPIDQRQRLYSSCFCEGELIRTPRNIIRFLNSVKLHWPPISEKADYSDLVWLQMVRLNNENLYNWIELYLIEVAALAAGGAYVDEADKVKMAEQLKEWANNGSLRHPRSYAVLSQYLPGVSIGEETESSKRLFNKLSEKVPMFVQNKRLGSPEHSRYYFAFAKPADALDDCEIASLIKSAENGEDLRERFRELQLIKRSQGGSKFDVLIDRLNYLEPVDFSNIACRSILGALADTSDNIDKYAATNMLSQPRFWTSATLLFRKLFATREKDFRVDLVKDVFHHGTSLGWLMSSIVRPEIFAHGLYGEKMVPEEERLFSSQELEDSISYLRERFKSRDRSKIIEAPALLDIMYGWKQAGYAAEVREWVREQLESDETFLKLLSSCQTLGVLLNPPLLKLKRQDLEHFLDFDQAISRLEQISEGAKKPEHHRVLAVELLRAVEFGKSV